MSAVAHMAPVERPQHPHRIGFDEGVARLVKIADRRITVQRQEPGQVLAFLTSSGVAESFGADAARVVATLIGGAR